ncbi:sugar phosphate isomerase/epimerase [Bacillus sp. JCM 19034]|uniref:sugar phosphate isomerase/epimerase family protein n=1 Tax=Bacillus sp. JCM 19034 TaxID=1481928 RepID=UPI000782E97D|nr:sugar phosphate isomerase/epimerase family protein [Bacillus sp. JCM 19034]
MKYSIFSVMTPDWTPEELLKNMSEQGYTAVEWRYKSMDPELKSAEPSFWGNNRCTITPDMSDQDLSKLRQNAMNLQISTLSINAYLRCGDLKETENVLKVANKLGADMIRLGVPSFDGRQHYHDLFKEARHYIGEAEMLCKQYGVKGLIETHHGTIAPSASLALRLVEGCNPSHIGVLYDPGNLVHEGYENHKLALQLLGEYLAHVHVKNAKWIMNEQRWHVEWERVEQGVICWEQVLRNLTEVGYTGYLGIEDFSRAFPSEQALEFHLSFLKQLGG